MQKRKYLPKTAGLAARSGLGQPLFKGLLMRRLNRTEAYAHSGRSRIGHLPDSGECRTVVIDPEPHLGSPRKRSRGFDKAAKEAQIAGDGHNLLFRLHIHDFHPGGEGVARRAMLFDLHKPKYEPLSPGSFAKLPTNVSFFT
jgi:hypothetical protein